MNRNSQLILIGAGATLIGTAVFLLKTSYTGDSLNILIARVYYKSGIGNPIYAANITISNPTENNITITRPELKAFLQGEQVGSSIPSQEVFNIKSKSKAEINNIEFQLEGLSLVKMVPDIFSYIRDKIKGAPAKITIELHVMVTANGISQTIKKQMNI